MKAKKKILARKIVESLGKQKGQKSLSKAMKDAGYSKSYSHNPQQLEATKSFQELLSQYLPDSLLVESHQRLFKASRLTEYEFDAGVSLKEIKKIVNVEWNCRLVKVVEKTWKDKIGSRIAYFFIPDNRAVKDALDMGYKLKGSYAAQKIKVEDPMGDMPDDELDKAIAEEEKNNRIKK